MRSDDLIVVEETQALLLQNAQAFLMHGSPIVISLNFGLAERLEGELTCVDCIAKLLASSFEVLARKEVPATSEHGAFEKVTLRHKTIPVRVECFDWAGPSREMPIAGVFRRSEGGVEDKGHTPPQNAAPQIGDAVERSEPLGPIKSEVEAILERLFWDEEDLKFIGHEPLEYDDGEPVTDARHCVGCEEFHHRHTFKADPTKLHEPGPTLQVCHFCWVESAVELFFWHLNPSDPGTADHPLKWTKDQHAICGVLASLRPDLHGDEAHADLHLEVLKGVRS